jgi:hypothetical protein
MGPTGGRLLIRRLLRLGGESNDCDIIPRDDCRDDECVIVIVTSSDEMPISIVFDMPSPMAPCIITNVPGRIVSMPSR